MARAAFEQSIALDSMRADAYGSAALMALADEDTVRAGPVLDACLRRVRRGVGRSTCAVLEAVLRRPSDPQTLALVDTAPTASVAQIYFGFADFPDQEQRAISFLRYIVDHREARSTRADIFEFAVPLYESLAQRGRGREAWKVGQGLREGPGGVADLALLGDFPEAEPIIRAMLRDTTIHYSATINWFAAHRDTTALREIGRRAERDLHSGNEDVRENGLYYLPLTEAWIRYARGDVAGALRTVKAISDTTCVRCFHNRLAEAEFLSAMGRDSAAAVVLGPTPIGPLSAALGNAWRLARAKVNARLSNNARAIEDYAFLARQWRDADETFQPRLREVQAALRSYDRMPDGRTRDDQGR
jgi:hypothetical protein